MKVQVFFFSSRRRHTRWTGDWSSDVCSSDLPSIKVVGVEPADAASMAAALAKGNVVALDQVGLFADGVAVRKVEIGRASCRERGYIQMMGGLLKRKRELLIEWLHSSTSPNFA